MAKFGVKQSDFSKGLTVTGSLVISGSQTITGSITSTAGFTGSLLGTASFALTASNLIGFDSSLIATGSITASVSDNPSNLFLIKSGSTTYLNVSSSGNAELYSNLFIIKNFTTQQPVLTISQSIVQFATQSLNPSGIAPNGGIWFTSASMYVGLD